MVASHFDMWPKNVTVYFNNVSQVPKKGTKLAYNFKFKYHLGPKQKHLGTK